MPITTSGTTTTHTMENNQTVATTCNALEIKSITPQHIPQPNSNYVSNDDSDACNITDTKCRMALKASANACNITAKAVCHLMGKQIKTKSPWFVPDSLEHQQTLF